eukprot:g9688.t1
MQANGGSVASSTATASPAAGGTPSTTSEPIVAAAPEEEGEEEEEAAGKGSAAGASGTSAVDIAYSEDASMVATASEDKQVRVWRTGVPGTSDGAGEPATAGAAGEVLGQRELPKKPTSLLFAPVATGPASGGGGGGGDDDGNVADGKGKARVDEVLVVADKCGDAYAAPLPDPSSALKHLLGHTAMTITATALLKEGTLLATADRAEHIRVSQFPRTTIVHAYLLGHKDFVSALAVVPGNGGVFLLSGGGDGMVGLWDAEAGKELAMISVRQACQDLADGDATSGIAGMDLEGDGDAEDEAADTGGGGVGRNTDGNVVEPDGGRENRDGKEDSRDGGDGGTKGGTAGAVASAEEGDSKGNENEGGGGVPLSVACSEDGKTVAVVVSGLKGLLLLSLSCGGGAAGSLAPRARVQLPSVPVQAGFLDGDLVVALPSTSSADCMQAFSLCDGREGAVPAESGSAREKCASLNAWAREQADGGMILKSAVPDDDASEALGGGLRKHRGSRPRNVGNGVGSWNNFSKRRDKNKKNDKKRKRPPPATPPAQPVSTDGSAD